MANSKILTSRLALRLSCAILAVGLISWPLFDPDGVRLAAQETKQEDNGGHDDHGDEHDHDDHTEEDGHDDQDNDDHGKEDGHDDHDHGDEHDHDDHGEEDGHDDLDHDDHGDKHDHDDHGKEDGHDDHGDGHDHDDHGDEHGHDDHERSEIKLTDAELEEFEVTTSVAASGELRVYTSLTGELALNADRLAHVVPRIDGVVREVLFSLGDRVEAGDVLGRIDSRELAVLKSSYLAARERVRLAEVRHSKIGSLWEQRIISEQEFLDSGQMQAEARIAFREAEQKLGALGLAAAGEPLARYEIIAPIGGTVIEKHMTLGEAVSADSTLLIIANLDELWAVFAGYPSDLGVVTAGTTISITEPTVELRQNAMIDYIAPVIDESTRTATIRAALDNRAARWRPGLFVNGVIEQDLGHAGVLIAKNAVQFIGEDTIVFVRSDQGFEARDVTLGREDRKNVEVVAGLDVGETYAASNAFILKAEMNRGSIDDGHNH